MDELPRRLLKAEEAARIVGMSRAVIYREIAAGRLKSVAIGRSRRVRPEALDEWVDAFEGVDSGVRAGEKRSTSGSIERETAVGAAS